MIVVDASVVLATLLQEPGGQFFANLTVDYRISTMNLGEVASRLSEKGHSNWHVRAAIEPLIINCVALTAGQAMQAGFWRNQTKAFGLSMGDRICLALALDLGAEVYTADRSWAALDLGVTVRLIR